MVLCQLTRTQKQPIIGYFKRIYSIPITLNIDNKDFRVTIIDEKYLWRYISMAYVINDTCISCGACEAGCPVGAISQGDDRYVVDAGTCIDCGACASNCPVGAPVQE